MPDAQAQFQNAVARVLEIVMFENWLRFYFISPEADDPDLSDLSLAIPEKSMIRIKELYPQLYPLAAQLNGKNIDFETSRAAVLAYIARETGAEGPEHGEIAQILQSATFQARLQMFHAWEQLHEDQLDQGFMEFGAWKNLFAKWQATPGAQELEKKYISAAS